MDEFNCYYKWWVDLYIYIILACCTHVFTSFVCVHYTVHIYLFLFCCMHTHMRCLFPAASARQKKLLTFYLTLISYNWIPCPLLMLRKTIYTLVKWVKETRFTFVAFGLILYPFNFNVCSINCSTCASIAHHQHIFLVFEFENNWWFCVYKFFYIVFILAYPYPIYTHKRLSVVKSGRNFIHRLYTIHYYVSTWIFFLLFPLILSFFLLWLSMYVDLFLRTSNRICGAFYFFSFPITLYLLFSYLHCCMRIMQNIPIHSTPSGTYSCACHYLRLSWFNWT